MPERLNGAVSKIVDLAKGPRVQIPIPPSLWDFDPIEVFSQFGMPELTLEYEVFSRSRATISPLFSKDFAIKKMDNS